MTNQRDEQPSFGRSFLKGLGWFLKFTLRLVFVVVVGVGLGLGVYLAASYGVRLINTQIMQPLHDNTQRLNDLEVYRLNDLEALDQRIAVLNEEVAALVEQNDNEREYLDSLDTRLTEAEGAVNAALSDITEIQTGLDAFVTEMDGVSQRLEEMDDAVGELVILTKELDETLLSVQTELSALTDEMDDDSALNVLRYDVMMLKAMESLTRARLFLTQDNTGLASEEIIAAREILLVLKSMVPDFQQKAVQDILDRLALSRGNLVIAPAIAVDDLEVAWQLLLNGLPLTSAEPNPLTIVPTSTVTATLNLTPTLSITATNVITSSNVVTP